MKKKLLLLTVLVIALSCLFAIGVSAADEVTVITDSGTDTVDFEEVFNLKDGYVAGFKDSATYGKHNVQDVIFPATIEGFNNSSKSLFSESIVIKSITFKGTSVDMNDCSSMFSKSSIESVIFEEGHNCILNVRRYTKGVFENCKSLTTVKFPTFTKLNSDGTSDTGDALGSMFSGCTNMVAQNDIVFGEGVVSLGGQMIFANCSSLSKNAEGKCEVYFPSSIKTINHRSFQGAAITAIHLDGCTALESIGSNGGSEGTLSGTKLTSIDFSDCTSLNYLCSKVMGDNTLLTTVKGFENTAVESLPTNAFNGCTALTSISFPNGITQIGEKAFYNCNALTGTYTFQNVTVIVDQAFRYAATNEGTNLILNFPSVEKIGTGNSNTYVFADSGITELTFGDDVSYMSYNTFTGATRLWRIEFDGAAEGFNFPSYTFEDCSALKAFSIPEGMTKLPSRMFKSCSSLTAVYLPSTLTTIESGSQDHATFANCTNLYFVSSAFKYDSLDDIPSKPDVYYFPSNLASIAGGEVFKKCENLNKTLVFPVGVTSLSNAWTFEAGINNPTLENIVFLGDMDNINTSSWRFTGKIYFANANDKSSSDITTYSNSKSTVFCNAEGNTNHLYEKTVETSATCTLNEGTHKLCFCGFVMESTDKEGGEKALGHTSKDATVVMYFPLLNGVPNYFEDAHNKYNCSRCNEEQDEVAEGTALFVGDRGYSYEEEGTSVLYRLHVNVDNIKAYSDTFKYGIVVSGAPSTAPITLVDGAITYGAQTLVFEMQSANYEFDYIQAKVTNIGTAELNCQAYAIDNNVVTYIGHNNVNALAEIVTYDAIFKAYGTTSGETKEN